MGDAADRGEGVGPDLLGDPKVGQVSVVRPCVRPSDVRFFEVAGLGALFGIHGCKFQNSLATHPLHICQIHLRDLLHQDICMRAV